VRKNWQIKEIDEIDFADDLLRSQMRDIGEPFTLFFGEIKSKWVYSQRMKIDDIIQLIARFAYAHPLAGIAYDTENILKKAGFSCVNYTGFPETLRYMTEDKLFLLVGLNELNTKKWADQEGYPLELEAEITEEWMFQMKSKLAFAARDASLKGRKVDGDQIFKRLYSPFYLHTPIDVYKQRAIANDQDATCGDMTPFKTADRAKIIIDRIEAKIKHGGSGIHLDELAECEEHPLIEWFCLHEPIERDNVYEKLTFFSIFSLPLDDIRNYYGEYVGFYFGYLEFYGKMLIWPSVFGIFVWFWQKSTGRINGPVTAILALLMILWAKFYYTMWVRQEHLYSVHWGQSSFEVDEDVRPQFVGQWAYSDIDGELRPYNPPSRVASASFRSNIVILTCICLLLGNLYAMIYVRKQFESKYDRDTLNGLLGVVVAVQIIIFDMLYEVLANWINELENHTTDVEFDEYLIWKSFLFRFVNFYNILFYLMIFKRFDQVGCGENSEDCLHELQVALAVIFILLIIWRNASEIIALKLQQWWNAGSSLLVSESDDVFEEFILEPYRSTFEDFNELVIQFGYVSIFIVAFPLAPLLALLSVMVELQIDAYKFTHLKARPTPKGARSIGSWKFIIYIIGWVATATNVALMVFMTSNIQELFDLDTDIQSRLLVFLVVEHIIIFFVVFTERNLQDPGREINEHVRRNEHVAMMLKRYNEKVNKAVEVWERWKPKEVAAYFKINAGVKFKEVADNITQRGIDGQKLKSIGEGEVKQFSANPLSQEWLWQTLKELRSTNQGEPQMLRQLAKLADVKIKAQEFIRRRIELMKRDKTAKPLEYSDIRFLTEEPPDDELANLKEDAKRDDGRGFDFPLYVWAFGDFLTHVEAKIVRVIFADEPFQLDNQDITDMLEKFLQIFWSNQRGDPDMLAGEEYRKMIVILRDYVKKYLPEHSDFDEDEIEESDIITVGQVLKEYGLKNDIDDYVEKEYEVQQPEEQESPGPEVEQSETVAKSDSQVQQTPQSDAEDLT